MQHLHRSVNHALLLHINKINARFLSDIIKMFRDKGWTLIDSNEAYKDPVYKLVPNIMPAGESLIWQIAKMGDDKTLRYPGEESVYEEPILNRMGL